MSVDPVTIAITIALNAAVMGLQASQKIEGPRATDLTATVADYGTPLNYVHGMARVQCPVFFVEAIREEKKQRKTKGGKYNEYTYYGTWAVHLADHLIAGVPRFWFDAHLVIDSASVGPTSIFSLNDGYLLENSVQFYLGTSDQEPNERMLSTIEAEKGAGTCPAYLDTAYAMFVDVPLEKLGNRYPQCSAEIVTDLSDIYPYETQDINVGAARLWGFTFSTDFSRMIWSDGTTYELWDVAARSRMISGNFPISLSLQGTYGISSNGTIYVRVGGLVASQTVRAFSPDGARIEGTIFSMSFQTNIRVLKDGDGREHIVTLTEGGINYCYHYTIGGFSGVNQIVTTDIGDGTSWSPRFAFVDSYGDVWIAGSQPAANSDNLYLYRVVDTGARPGSIGFVHLNHGFNAPSPPVYATHYDGHFIVAIDVGNRLFKIEDETMTIVADVSHNPDTYNAYKQWANLRPNSTSIWTNNAEISLSDLSTIRTVTLTNWSAGLDSDGIIYDPINNALITFPQFSAQITHRYLDRTSSDGVTLQSIVENLADRVGARDTDIDASALDQIVRGFNWVQAPAKDILLPLLEIHDAEPRPHDFQIQFIKRGSAIGSTLATEDFVRTGNDALYEITVVNDTDLPRRIFLTYADFEHDLQPNTAMAQRPADNVDSSREMSIDMTTLVMTDSEAQQRTERLLRRRWFEYQEIRNGLTQMELAIEVGDLHSIECDGIEIAAKAYRQVIRQDGVIEMRWVRDDPAITSLSGSEGAEFAGHADSVLLTPGLSRGFVLDIPLLADVDDQSVPFLYVAAAPYSEGVFWPGADILHSDTGDSSDYAGGWGSVPASSPVSWGHCSDALGAGVLDVVDEGAGITVVMQYGSLASITETEFQNSESLNLAIVGSEDTGFEIIQFMTATLVGTKTYEISNIRRGIQGTEQYMSGHAAGDVFIIVSSVISKRSVGASEIADTDYYKPITQGRSESSGIPIELLYSSAALKPLSPVHLSAVLDSGTGDWDISWTRRTRLGGNNIDGQDVPLGESSEGYEVDFYNGADVVRTLSSATESVTYSSADQTTDFGSPQSSLSYRTRQISPVLNIDGFEAVGTA